MVNLGTKFNDNNEWTLGRRVIEIENMADQMVCQQCGTLFHIRDTISKKLYGLASLFTLLCSSCNTTRKKQVGINFKVTIGMSIKCKKGSQSTR